MAGIMMEPSGQEKEGFPKELPEKANGVWNQELGAHLEHTRNANLGWAPVEYWSGQWPMFLANVGWITTMGKLLSVNFL